MRHREGETAHAFVLYILLGRVVLCFVHFVECFFLLSANISACFSSTFISVFILCTAAEASSDTATRNLSTKRSKGGNSKNQRRLLRKDNSRCWRSIFQYCRCAIVGGESILAVTRTSICPSVIK